MNDRCSFFLRLLYSLYPTSLPYFRIYMNDVLCSKGQKMAVRTKTRSKLQMSFGVWVPEAVHNLVFIYCKAHLVMMGCDFHETVRILALVLCEEVEFLARAPCITALFTIALS